MMADFETWGVNYCGDLIHAGVHRARAASLKEAYRLNRKWERWKRRQLRERGPAPAGSMPLDVKLFYMHPVGKPDEVRGFHFDRVGDWGLNGRGPRRKGKVKR